MLQATRLVTVPVDVSRMVSLPGNVRPEATSASDRGRVSDSLPMEHMLMQLQRPAERQAALDARIENQYKTGDVQFHKWLAPGQLGEEFGPNPADIAAVTEWLRSQGFEINTVSKSGMTIDFSGTAGEVTAAFGTELHNLDVRGEAHIANMQEPEVPAALASVIIGVASLHDFRPHAAHTPISSAHFDAASKSIVRRSASEPEFAVNGEYQLVVPDDLHTIYNFKPVYKLGATGKGQAIALIEDTNLYTTEDWKIFRDKFGLSGYTAGSITQVHPGNCKNPGVLVGDDGEAILDAEYASAAAPDASIVLASCANTSATFGGLLAIQALVDETFPPQIVSISYGECESAIGAAGNAAYRSAYEQAASEGISVFVSSGDDGAAGCDPRQEVATHGIRVNGFASTPYNVAVGGTDFGDSYAGTGTAYWSATNNSLYGSALSYVPEVPWNDSCAGTLISSILGYSRTYGVNGFCNSAVGEEYFLTTGSGSGGPSACSLGSSRSYEGGAAIISTCKGYPKPSYQENTFGNPYDNVRDVPDVSLFAGNGVWGHYYVYCYSDLQGGGSACTGTPSTWSGAGGTSFATPIVAGVQALVNQSVGEPQGNPNYIYYALAKREFGPAGSGACNATKGNAINRSCVFHDVTLGDIDVNCVGPYNCYTPSGANGVLSLSDTAYEPAYPSHSGWDFATGIGSFDVYKLVENWKSAY